MSTEPVYVTQPTPIDLSAVRDHNMQALIGLAVSLGWNVHKKHNGPAVITARDGHQRRIPTDTSIRMSVFQTALSSILLHTDNEQWVPTTTLAEALIKDFKVDIEHARRLRLSMAESKADHENHLRALESAAGQPKDPQPVTQRIELEWADPPGEEFPEWTDESIEEALMVPKPPAVKDPAEMTDDYQRARGAAKPKLTTKQIMNEQKKIKLVPLLPVVTSYPSEEGIAEWALQLAKLPHVVEVRPPLRKGDRSFLARKVILDNGEAISMCGWPGCRHWTEGRLQGHINAHRPTIAMGRPAITPKPGKAQPELSHPVTEPDAFNVIDRLTDGALALLEIAQHFVGDLDELTAIRGGDSELRARVVELEDENEKLRVKAERYDQLRQMLGGE
jgi:hypothetical protein